MRKVSEVYEKQIKKTTERPDGSEFVTFAAAFGTREMLINEDYIVSIHPHEFTSSTDLEKINSTFPEGESTKFSLFVMDGNSFRKSELVVVGSFEQYCRWFQK